MRFRQLQTTLRSAQYSEVSMLATCECSVCPSISFVCAVYVLCYAVLLSVRSKHVAISVLFVI